MTRIKIFIIVVFALFLSGCSTTRKTTETDTKSEAQLTATTDKQVSAETAGHTTIISDVKTDERQNVIIDFAKVEFYTDDSTPFSTDSTAAGWFKSVVTSATSEERQKAKPPNVKSITKGRAIINGEKTESRTAEAIAESTMTEDTATKADIKATHKDATKTDTEEKPKFTFWDWLYITIVGTFLVGCIIIMIRIARKLLNNTKK